MLLLNILTVDGGETDLDLGNYERFVLRYMCGLIAFYKC